MDQIALLKFPRVASRYLVCARCSIKLEGGIQGTDFRNITFKCLFLEAVWFKDCVEHPKLKCNNVRVD